MMHIEGKIWQSPKGKLWLAEIPFLDLMVQATRKEEIPEMVKDAIELLVDDPKFEAAAKLSGDTLVVDSNNPAELSAFILKRQRAQNLANR